MLESARRWINQRHEYWCTVVELFIRDNFPEVKLTRPSVLISDIAKKVNCAGYYHQQKHKCQYFIAYRLVVKDKYDETIAHEVCHAYQNVLCPGSKWHGEMWNFLLKKVCGFYKSQNGHSHPVKLVKKMNEYIALRIEHDKR